MKQIGMLFVLLALVETTRGQGVNHKHLKELDQHTGRWAKGGAINIGGDWLVWEISEVKWALDGNFLVIEGSGHRGLRSQRRRMEILGWDPIRKQRVSWRLLATHGDGSLRVKATDPSLPPLSFNVLGESLASRYTDKRQTLLNSYQRRLEPMVNKHSSGMKSMEPLLGTWTSTGGRGVGHGAKLTVNIKRILFEDAIVVDVGRHPDNHR
jgi:hypothetical protein